MFFDCFFPSAKVVQTERKCKFICNFLRCSLLLAKGQRSCKPGKKQIKKTHTDFLISV